jgi:molecular chaperone HscB
MKKVAVAVENPSMFDPFKTLGMEESFSIDRKRLDKLYFETLKQIHPDRLRNVSNDSKDFLLQKAGEVNKAYGILKDPIQRAHVLLEKAGVKPLSHDPLFLSEVLHWNERLEAGEKMNDEIKKEEKRLLEALDKAFEKKDFRKAKSTLYRLSYVKNFLKTFEELS